MNKINILLQLSLSFRLRTSVFGLRSSDFSLPTSDSGLQSSDYLKNILNV